MFSLYDLAEVGACLASFLTMLFVLVRKPHNVSAHTYVAAAFTTFLMWVAFIVYVPRPNPLLGWQEGVVTALLALAGSFWLLFLLVFARESSSNILRGRSLTVYGLLLLFVSAIVVSFIVPLFHLEVDRAGDRFFLITPLGRYFVILIIIACTFGLLQLESTYRASLGQLRRSLILPLLLLSSMLAVLLVAAMMGLLYSRIDFVGIQLCALLSIGAMVAA